MRGSVTEIIMVPAMVGQIGSRTSGSASCRDPVRDGA